MCNGHSLKILEIPQICNCTLAENHFQSNVITSMATTKNSDKLIKEEKKNNLLSCRPASQAEEARHMVRFGELSTQMTDED